MTLHRLNETWQTATQLLAADYITARKKLELTVRYNGSRTEYRYVVTRNGLPIPCTSFDAAVTEYNRA